MPVGADHDFPFHRRALPLPSTVMQNDADRQETEVRTPPPLSTGLVADHVGSDHETPFQVNA